MRSIVVAAPPGHVGDLGGHDLGVVPGGATRAQSVANALAAVGTELVAIHDAARPLLTPELVEALVADLDADPEAAGVIAAAPVTDTIKRAASREPAIGHLTRRQIIARDRGDRGSRRGCGRRRRRRCSGREALREALGGRRAAARRRPTRRCWSRRRAGPC